MTIALVQSKANTGITPTGLAFDATPTAGNLLLCGWVDRNGTNNDSHVDSEFTQAETHVAGFGSARLEYKEAQGDETGEIYADVGVKTVAWIAEFSGVDVGAGFQHDAYLHNGSGDRVNSTKSFTVAGGALLVGLHYGDAGGAPTWTPITDSTELHEMSINNVETPRVAVSYRIVTTGGTYDVGEQQAAGADALAGMFLAWDAGAGAGGGARSQSVIVL